MSSVKDAVSLKAFCEKVFYESETRKAAQQAGGLSGRS